MKKFLLSVLVLGIVGCSNTGQNSINPGGRLGGVRPMAVADISPSAPAGYNGNYNASYADNSVGGRYNPNVLTPIQPLNTQAAEPITVPTYSSQPAVAIPASARVSSGTYTVQKGDTLSKIAQDRYGSSKMWTKIAAANPGMNPNSIKAGQKINMP